MSEAPAIHTAGLMGATIDGRNNGWRWVNELERYTMPGCLFCESCYQSLPCEVFLAKFRESTPPVVCATRARDGAYEIIASLSALEQERSIRPDDNHILRDLGLERSTLGGQLESLIARGRARLEGLFATKVNVPPALIHRAGAQFAESFKVGIAEEAAPFVGFVEQAQRANAAHSAAVSVADVRRKWMLPVNGPITAEQIQQRFAQLSTIAHPDHAGGSDAAMRELLAERNLLLASL